MSKTTLFSRIASIYDKIKPATGEPDVKWLFEPKSVEGYAEFFKYCNDAARKGRDKIKLSEYSYGLTVAVYLSTEDLILPDGMEEKIERIPYIDYDYYYFPTYDREKYVYTLQYAIDLYCSAKEFDFELTEDNFNAIMLAMLDEYTLNLNVLDNGKTVPASITASALLFSDVIDYLHCSCYNVKGLKQLTPETWMFCNYCRLVLSKPIIIDNVRRTFRISCVPATFELGTYIDGEYHTVGNALRDILEQVNVDESLVCAFYTGAPEYILEYMDLDYSICSLPYGDIYNSIVHPDKPLPLITERVKFIIKQYFKGYMDIAATDDELQTITDNCCKLLEHMSPTNRCTNIISLTSVIGININAVNIAYMIHAATVNADNLLPRDVFAREFIIETTVDAVTWNIVNDYDRGDYANVNEINIGRNLLKIARK